MTEYMSQRCYYNRFRMNDILYTVGDCLEYSTESSRKIQVGRIKSVWSDSQTNENMIKIHKFLFPDETSKGRIGDHFDDDELLLYSIQDDISSDHEENIEDDDDDPPVALICTIKSLMDVNRCQVIPSHKRKKIRQMKKLTKVYRYRYQYSAATESISDLQEHRISNHVNSRRTDPRDFIEDEAEESDDGSGDDSDEEDEYDAHLMNTQSMEFVTDKNASGDHDNLAMYR